MNTSTKTAERCLHLIDIENLTSGVLNISSQSVNNVLNLFLRVSKWKLGDLLVIAANPGLMKVFAFDLFELPARLLCGKGPDGADKLLLSAVPKNLESSFNRIVVGSGDHIFAPLLRGTRLEKTVVYGCEGSLSWELYSSANQVIQLDL